MKSTLYFVFLGVVLILFFFRSRLRRTKLFLGTRAGPEKAQGICCTEGIAADVEHKIAFRAGAVATRSLGGWKLAAGLASLKLMRRRHGGGSLPVSE